MMSEHMEQQQEGTHEIGHLRSRVRELEEALRAKEGTRVSSNADDALPSANRPLSVGHSASLMDDTSTRVSQPPSLQPGMAPRHVGPAPQMPAPAASVLNDPFPEPSMCSDIPIVPLPGASSSSHPALPCDEGVATAETLNASGSLHTHTPVATTTTYPTTASPSLAAPSPFALAIPNPSVSPMPEQASLRTPYPANPAVAPTAAPLAQTTYPTVSSYAPISSAPLPTPMVPTTAPMMVPPTAPQYTSQYTSPNTQQLMNPQGASKLCQCRKSKCLKLYCECFAANVFCKDCKCTDCQNVPEHAEARMNAIRYKLSRRPGAFNPKFTDSSPAVAQKEIVRHSRGCNCKKSGCNKRYCECFQNGVACSSACKCSGCKNTQAKHKQAAIYSGHMTGCMEEWKIPLSQAQVEAMGTKSTNKRKLFPADFIPGQEPDSTFYCGPAPPALPDAPQPPAQQPALHSQEPPTKKRRSGRAAPSSGRAAPSSRPGGRKHRRTRSEDSTDSPPALQAPSFALSGEHSNTADLADCADSLYSCNSSHSSNGTPSSSEDDELQLLDADPDFTADPDDFTADTDFTAALLASELDLADMEALEVQPMQPVPSVISSTIDCNMLDWSAVDNAMKGSLEMELEQGSCSQAATAGTTSADDIMGDFSMADIEAVGSMSALTEHSADTLCCEEGDTKASFVEGSCDTLASRGSPGRDRQDRQDQCSIASEQCPPQPLEPWACDAFLCIDSMDDDAPCSLYSSSDKMFDACCSAFACDTLA